MTESTIPPAVPTKPTALPADAAAKKHILVLAGLMVTMLLASLDQMIFSTALPTIVGERTTPAVEALADAYAAAFGRDDTPEFRRAQGRPRCDSSHSSCAPSQ